MAPYVNKYLELIAIQEIFITEYNLTFAVLSLISVSFYFHYPMTVKQRKEYCTISGRNFRYGIFTLIIRFELT